ncbi:MAG: VWA domain-containing protein [Epsilonproteobacteria bacterium]|nr:VWA domain-containing protein [Campylobacterota bacterium]
MFDGIYFELPKAVSFLFIYMACASLCPMRLTSIYFPHTASFVKSTASHSKLLFFLKWLGIVMLVLAIMSPVKDVVYDTTPQKGHAIGLVLDTSESMKQRGFDPNNPLATRFDVVKEIVGDFISKRKDDNIGMVVFGSFSFIASPLTYDTDILKDILSRLDIGIAGRFTALYTALAQGVNLLSMSEAKSKVLILLTDGYSTPQVDKIPLDVVLDMIKKEHIKVYPIGIGSNGEYNKKVLLKIAKASGGVAFGARSADELSQIYKQIDKMEKSEIKSQKFTYKKYFYHFPLFIGLLSLMFYVYLLNRRGSE